MTASPKVTFETNIPQTIALQFADGKAVTSQFGGEEIMFSLVDGRRMYLAPFVADKLAQEGIEARKPFEICKREVARGRVEFQVRKLEEERKGATASTWQKTAAPSPASDPAGSTKTNNVRPQHTAPVAEQESAALSPISARLCAALCAAVDAAIESEVYAEKRGMHLEFEAEDIRALAITVFIDQCKGGR